MFPDVPLFILKRLPGARFGDLVTCVTAQCQVFQPLHRRLLGPENSLLSGGCRVRCRKFKCTLFSAPEASSTPIPPPRQPRTCPDVARGLPGHARPLLGIAHSDSIIMCS